MNRPLLLATNLSGGTNIHKQLLHKHLLVYSVLSTVNCRKQPDSTNRICQRWPLPLTQLNLLADVEPTLTSLPLSGRKSPRGVKEFLRTNYVTQNAVKWVY